MFLSTLDPILVSLMLAGVVSSLLVIFGEPILIWFLEKQGARQPIRNDGPEEHKKKKVPTFGGTVMVAAIVIASSVSGQMTSVALACLGVILTFGAIGFFDDLLKVVLKNPAGLPGRTKLLLQLVLTFATMLTLVFSTKGLALPMILAPSLGGVQMAFTVVFAIFVVVGAANSVNLTDGLDGLAAGCTVPTSAILALYAYMEADPGRAAIHGLHYLTYATSLAVILVTMTAASSGFLVWNRYPAKIFMGDTGALALGGGLGIIAVCLRLEIVLGLAGIIFVLETLSVIIQTTWYKRTKKRVFRMAPLHHHYEAVLPETEVTRRFCGVAWLMALLLALPLVL